LGGVAEDIVQISRLFLSVHGLPEIAVNEFIVCGFQQHEI
jgi:hypothetical protein